MKTRKGGRKRKEGAREASGRPQRGQADGGTPELILRKLSVTGDMSLELTPLGILMGRHLITAEQYVAAARFRALHLSVFRDGPKASLPMMAKLPSDPGPWDADDAAERQDRAGDTWESKLVRWHTIHDNLTLPQWELVQAIVIHEEFGGIDTTVFGELVARNIVGSRCCDSHGRRASNGTVLRVNAIAHALDRLQPQARTRWTEMSESQRNAMEQPHA